MIKRMNEWTPKEKRRKEKNEGRKEGINTEQ